MGQVMKETRITFPTSALAKDKGFDLEVNGFFNKHGVLVEQSNHGNTSFKDWNNYNEPIGKAGKCYNSAPTQSFLQAWIRKIHGLHIEVMVSNRHIPNKGLVYSFIILEPDLSENRNCITHVAVSKEPYNSYEEALEEGLQEALKLI